MNIIFEIIILYLINYTIKTLEIDLKIICDS